MTTYGDRLYFKETYEYFTRAPFKSISPTHGLGIDPYMVANWSKHFTPIEAHAWHAIRGVGVMMYPEYPVLEYFIDFANPILKIGLECDGKKWHNLERDKIRDRKLLTEGWKIFRVTGKECCSKLSLEDIDEKYDGYDYTPKSMLDEYEDYFMNSCDGVVKALKVFYFQKSWKDCYEPYKMPIYNTLDKHRIIDFDL